MHPFGMKRLQLDCEDGVIISSQFMSLQVAFPPVYEQVFPYEREFLRFLQ